MTDCGGLVSRLCVACSLFVSWDSLHREHSLVLSFGPQLLARHSSTTALTVMHIHRPETQAHCHVTTKSHIRYMLPPISCK